MPEHLFMARLFLTGARLLAVISLVLWLILPIPSMFPPYLATALLALGYGMACQWRGCLPGVGKS
jgi:hypothetical protein